MRNKVFRLQVTALTLMLITSAVLSVEVGASEEENVIMPRWSILYFMDLDIVFPAEGEGIVVGTATGQSNVTSLEGTIRLYEYVDGKWMFMESFSNTSTYRSLGVEGYFEPVRGRAYKAYFYVTAYSADDAERTYCNYEKTCP